MGNTSSSTSSPKFPKSLKPRRWRLTRKRSAALFSCLDAQYYDDSQPTETFNEKFNEKIHQHRRHASGSSTNSTTPLTPLTYYTPPPAQLEAKHDEYNAFRSFVREYPEYQLTWIIDTLRRTDYARLDTIGETYVDYMGGAIYPESLVRVHTQLLNNAVLGNTHSISNSSQLSARHADEARQAVLSFFDAPSDDYIVVFTPNASGALKLVGESFPFLAGSSYVLGVDSHNSVHGIRQYASVKGANVAYIPSLPQGGVDISVAKETLDANRPQAPALTPALFGLTAQSNISNSKNPLSLLEYAASLGYHTLLDAAALAPTSSISLSKTPVDAMAVSFYKMFGYPTGIGALVLRRSFAQEVLQRPWFAGGNVDVVQVPGTIVTRSEKLEEQFEDGTINYLMLPAVTDGLRFLSAYLPFLPLRLSCLMHYAVSSLSSIKHPSTGQSVIKILSRPPIRRLRHVGDQSDVGSTLSMIFLDPEGAMLPLSFVSHAAHTHSISLRTGCMCNPGGSAALLSIESDMEKLYSGVRLRDFERFVGRELGVVRVSLGLASNWHDVWKIVLFANKFADSAWRGQMWSEWTQQRFSSQCDAGRGL